ncbi:flagellar hook protein FlgE [Jiella sonneratiae]|uniref:Flagellar hook protein FlgE n=1 Tax=Jiella sonneratiae TaxID=2816856 RepID=A0ABS3J1M7_9HYPH|nr:flagellar hook protein FlgE [Jiella sonneratiae]MBO0903584.1 flagellar hook protein FlgE [Jiella sonneratiae]
MSINGVFRTSVSGMNAQANRLSAISDNISNSSTDGYKRSEAEFSTLVIAQSGGQYNSGSVKTETRQYVSTQGSIAATSSSTDVAISGDGFFVVQDNTGREFYTRAGSFVQKTSTVNGEQTTYLVNSAGYRLTGTSEEDGTTGPIQLPVGELVKPKATDSASLNLQLPSTAELGDDGKKTTTITVYDNIGSPITLTMTLTKLVQGDATTSTNSQWSVELTDGTSTTTQTVEFDPTTGRPVSVTPDGGTATAVPDDDLSDLTMDITLAAGNEVAVNFGSLTEYDTDFSAKVSANGNPPGYFSDFSIGDDGVLSGVMDNGTLVSLYQLNLARFTSPDMLQAGVGNVYSATLDSGTAEYGLPGSNGFGSLVSSAVEQSNVDLATELTDMIESQRSYSANSKVFQTGSEILDVLINLKR